jgi:hypothetical protein
MGCTDRPTFNSTNEECLASPRQTLKRILLEVDRSISPVNGLARISILLSCLDYP